MRGAWETDKSLQLIQGATVANTALYLMLLQTTGFAKLTKSNHDEMRDTVETP